MSDDAEQKKQKTRTSSKEKARRGLLKPEVHGRVSDTAKVRLSVEQYPRKATISSSKSVKSNVD